MRTIRCNVLLFALLQAFVLTGCDQGEAQVGSTEVQRLWRLLVADDGADPRIRKWASTTISMLMIVDQGHASQLIPQTSELVDGFNERSPVQVALCADVVRPDAKLERQSGVGCSADEFDSYLVVASGYWGGSSWTAVSESMPTWASDRLQALMATTDGKGGLCELVLRPRSEGSHEIAGAVSVIDISYKKAVGACFVGLFLGSLGVAPFDGQDKLDVRAEAMSYAEFLRKEKPNGAIYLTKVLYSPDLRPGMDGSEAQPIIKRLIAASGKETSPR